MKGSGVFPILWSDRQEDKVGEDKSMAGRQPAPGQTVGILGAGAIGSYMVMGLSEKYGDRLWVIADGERKARLEEQGLCINGRPYSLHVRSPKQARGVDVLFVCLKYNGLYGALDDIATIAGEGTIVVSLLNGIDSEEIIGGRIGMEKLIYSLIRISAQREGNAIHFPLPKGTTGIYIGMPGKDGGQDPKVQTVAQVLSGTPIVYHVSNDILQDMWNKFGLNIARNLPQAVLGVGAGAYDDSIYVSDLCKKLRHEVVVIARAKGVEISETFSPGDYKPSQRYSTLQDLDAGRVTEIEMFSGALIRMGEQLKIPCPYNEMIYDLIKALEEKNSGRFTY